MDIKVILFDDNEKRRESLQMLIELMDNMEFAGAFPDCRHVLKNMEDTQPDVVLMDIDMPFVNGIEGVKLIRQQYQDVKILMQTVFEEDDKVFAAICAGADGYILKQTNPLKLMDAIKEVHEGGAPMTPNIARKVLQYFNKSNACKEQTFELTNRELEILEHLVKGNSYNMIATACGISYATVNSHISKIYKKLKVKSSAGAVSIAVREGLVG
ncbi:MAG: response regulator transcription factor [Chitinophagales bacterium]